MATEDEMDFEAPEVPTPTLPEGFAKALEDHWHAQVMPLGAGYYILREACYPLTGYPLEGGGWQLSCLIGSLPVGRPGAVDALLLLANHELTGADGGGFALNEDGDVLLTRPVPGAPDAALLQRHCEILLVEAQHWAHAIDVETEHTASPATEEDALTLFTHGRA